MGSGEERIRGFLAPDGDPVFACEFTKDRTVPTKPADNYFTSRNPRRAGSKGEYYFRADEIGGVVAAGFFDELAGYQTGGG